MATQGRLETSAHRRNGETVSLKDPAWRLWCAKAAAIEALPCASVLAKCLPDDLNPDGLTLLVADVASLTALREGAGKALANLLGMHGLTRIHFYLDRALWARAAAARGARALAAGETVQQSREAT